MNAIPASKPLTPKQHLFIDEFMLNGRNATQAYLTVYKCNPKHAGRLAGQLMKNNGVREEIARRVAAYSVTTGLQVCDGLLVVKEIIQNPENPPELRCSEAWKLVHFLNRTPTPPE